MQQIQIEPVRVRRQEFIEGRLSMGRQKPHPSDGNRLVIFGCSAMMSGKGLNPRTDICQRDFQRFAMQMQPRQTEVIRIAKFGSLQVAGMEGCQKFLIAQMGGSQCRRHPRIVAF